MSMEFFKPKILLAAGAGIGTAAIAYWYYQDRKQFIQPSKWKRVGVLENLYYYPIKSCYPLILDSGVCDDIGIRNGNFKDRQFMLIDAKNNAVDTRNYLQLLKIKPKIINGELYVTAPDMEPLCIAYEDINENNKGDVKVKFFKVDVCVSFCGEKYDKWFSKFLLDKDNGLRLAYYPYSNAVKPKYPIKEFATKIFRTEDTGSFHYSSSYMLINNASIDELNTRLEACKETKVNPIAFRGNFYVKTDDKIPFDEDNWNWIKIGDDVIMRTVAPCYRCIVPNIDPESGKRNPNMEPLKTLKTYRIPKGSIWPIMGLQLGVRQNGHIKKGDVIYVSAA